MDRITIGLEKNLGEAYELFESPNSPLIRVQRRLDSGRGGLIVGFGDRQEMVIWGMEERNGEKVIPEDLIVDALGLNVRTELSTAMYGPRDLAQVAKSTRRILNYLSENNISSYAVLRREAPFGNVVSIRGRNISNRSVVSGVGNEYVVR